MGAVTRLDPSTTQNLANQPGTSPGKPIESDSDSSYITST